jgi:hypothetical protein
MAVEHPLERTVAFTAVTADKIRRLLLSTVVFSICSASFSEAFLAWVARPSCSASSRGWAVLAANSRNSRFLAPAAGAFTVIDRHGLPRNVSLGMAENDFVLTVYPELLPEGAEDTMDWRCFLSLPFTTRSSEGGAPRRALSR